MRIDEDGNHNGRDERVAVKEHVKAVPDPLLPGLVVRTRGATVVRVQSGEHHEHAEAPDRKVRETVDVRSASQSRELNEIRKSGDSHGSSGPR